MKGEYTKKLDHSINQSCMNVIKSRGGGGEFPYTIQSWLQRMA